MTNSAEIRWFFQGIINNNILGYFRDKHVVFKEEPPRTDWYLKKNDKFSSIKLRNGNLEVKKLSGTIDGFQINHSISGNAEKWVKFIFGSGNGGEARNIAAGNYPDWIRVDKQRSIVRFEQVENVIVAATDQSRDVILLEICFVRVLNLDFWTLAIEASGNDTNSVQLLESGATHIFPDDTGIEFLKPAHSFGYPELLSKLSYL
jgi:hypothetical protein